MKTTLKLFSLCIMFLAFVGCSDDDEDPLTEFTVTAITPDSGTVGTEITITGTNFPTNASDVNLTFGGAAATISSISSTQIVTMVPNGATSGDVSIAANGFTKSTPTSFTVLSELISSTFSNLHAPQTGGFGQGEIGGPFTKFSFETGDVTESETDWDIAFRGLLIAVNGGASTGSNDEPARNGDAAASVQTGIFSEIISADGLTFEQDADGAFAIPAGSGNGWYNYNGATMVVTAIPGRVLVFKTHDGKYAKVEILSYYKDAPAEITPEIANSDFRYYTFNYVYNPNEGETSLAN